VNQVTYPSGRQLNYGLAGSGGLTAGRDGVLWRMDATSGDPVGYVSGASYAPHGEIAQMPFGECGGGGYFSYDQRLRPMTILYSTAPAMSALGQLNVGISGRGRDGHR
jgi:hypothetical protein